MNGFGMDDLDMKAHSEIRELLTLAAAGVLDAAEQRQVEEHLVQCEACRADFQSLGRLTGALQKQVMPQAPRGLVQQTRRILELRLLAQRDRRRSYFFLGALAILGWTLTLLNWPLLHLMDGPLIRAFNLSGTQLTWMWTTYILAAWLGTALAAAVLGKRFQQEGRSL
jgi:anti-sigma factor RsiW